jgi:hypothetical protein
MVTIMSIVATIVAITIATVASTASAGGILVGATSLLARTIVGSFGRTLAARLVLLELGKGAVVHVISNGKNTGSGTKPTLIMYSIQLSTYITCYLSAFGAILKDLF